MVRELKDLQIHSVSLIPIEQVLHSQVSLDVLCGNDGCDNPAVWAKITFSGRYDDPLCNVCLYQVRP